MTIPPVNSSITIPQDVEDLTYKTREEGVRRENFDSIDFFVGGNGMMILIRGLNDVKETSRVSQTF